MSSLIKIKVISLHRSRNKMERNISKHFLCFSIIRLFCLDILKDIQEDLGIFCIYKLNCIAEFEVRDIARGNFAEPTNFIESRIAEF